MVTENELNERVTFMLDIPFFHHWFRKKMRNIMISSKSVKTIRGQILQTEGLCNDNVYIIRRGEFEAVKKRKTPMPTRAEHVRVKEFLQGTQAKRSVRSIFNEKINRVTKKSGLTAVTTHVGEETVTFLGPGQLFGEGRFLKIFDRFQKELSKRAVPVESKQDQKKLPLEFADDAEMVAPYSVKCSSMTGEVLSIRGVDFYRLVLKDKATSQILGSNLGGRIQSMKIYEDNKHEEFKFHNVQGKEVDSLLDSGSERYISDDEKGLQDH